MLDRDIEQQLYLLHADVCRALADPKRLRIIAALQGEEQTVAQLSEALVLPQSNTSHHLAVLRRLGLVRARRQGLHIYYSLTNRKIVEACTIMREVLLERLASEAKLSRELRAAGRRAI